MNCPRHPNKRVVTYCRECGTGFCIECVRETDQTTLCAECHRRRVSEFSRELTSPDERLEDTAVRPSTGVAGAGPGDAAIASPPAISAESGAPESYASAEEKVERKEGAARRPVKSGRLWKFARKEGRTREGHESPGLETREEATMVGDAASHVGAESDEAEDFLSLGPDEDFSELARAAERRRLWFPGRRRTAAKEIRGRHGEEAAGEVAAEPGEGVARGEGEPGEGTRYRVAKGDVVHLHGKEMAEKPSGKGSHPSAAAAAPEEELLDDVLSRLLRPEGAKEEAPARGRETGARAPAAESVEEVLSTLLRPEREAPAKPREEKVEVAALEERLAGAHAPSVAVEEAAPRPRREERRRRREERAERWSFLAQPRASEHTELAARWWGAALFIFLVLLLGALLWALPNAYLVPKDTEYGIHAVAIGIVLGLLFWWKAGRKHGTKLAVQAALTTFFALFLGEFFHWFLSITKNAALRTIFFDLVSFRFLWEHGAEIMRRTMEAMFPGAFVWIMIMPTLLAFLVGFGMPPIPEIFFQFGRAVRK